MSGADPAALSAMVRVENAVKRFGAFAAVDGVSFEVREGETFGLLGPNGAGKSTLIRLMTTLLPLTSGRVTIDGYDVDREPDEVRRTIGVIPQNLTSDLDLTVEENLHIYAKLYDMAPRERRTSVDELLGVVELTKWRKAQTKTLSGGMRRRLEIARGLIHRPRVFFLDEPTTGLDPISRVGVWDMLARVQGERRLTALITTHYMDEADRLCDRIAIIDHGRLAALDTPMALKARVPGSNVIEVQFDPAPEGWADRLDGIPGVVSVHPEGGGMYRLLTAAGPATATALLQAAAASGAGITSLSVQNTTLDDVFVHFTGRQLRDEVVKPKGGLPPRPGVRP